MKKVMYAVLFIFAITSLKTQAQSTFDRDMTDLHSQIFKTCGIIKSKTKHNDKVTLKSLAELKDQITKLEKEYVNNPPKEYANDPLFGSYFYQLKDVVDILSERIKRGDYKSAIMNCSGFCKTFNKMHMINGTLDLTDAMFMWNMQITMTNYMINAKNYKGASMSVNKVPGLYKMVIGLKNKKNSADFNKQFAPLDAIYQKWLKAIQSKDYKASSEQAKAFSAAFPMIFKSSL
jgi:hypothetical protein